MRTIRLIYPQERSVTHEQIMAWYADRLCDGDTTEKAENIVDAIAILEDLGYITVNGDDYKELVYEYR